MNDDDIAYFQEFSSFSIIQWIFFPLGLILNLLGVYILSARDMKQVGVVPIQQVAFVKSSDVHWDDILSYVMLWHDHVI